MNFIDNTGRRAVTTVFHATTKPAAENIATHGFRDSPGSAHRRAGVWVADIPLTESDIAGPMREAWFQIEVPNDVLEDFEYAPSE